MNTSTMSPLQHKPIAPKVLQPHHQPNGSPQDSVSSSTNPPMSSGGGQLRHCRRKIAFHPTLGYAIAAPQPAKVARRNARERNRVKQVNNGFELLREHIPSCAEEKKMSKVDTLRHAVDYIRTLQRMLGEQHKDRDGAQHEPASPKDIKEEDESRYSPPHSSDSQLHQLEQQQHPPMQHHQQHHFQYPSPLTPRTPTSSSLPYCYESGYETTSSYYSHSPGLVSPHQHQQSFPMPTRPASSSSSSLSPPSEAPPPPSSSSFPVASFVGSYYGDDGGALAQHRHHSQDEQESELLDAIVDWQDD